MEHKKTPPRKRDNPIDPRGKKLCNSAGYIENIKTRPHPHGTAAKYDANEVKNGR